MELGAQHAPGSVGSSSHRENGTKRRHHDDCCGLLPMQTLACCNWCAFQQLVRYRLMQDGFPRKTWAHLPLLPTSHTLATPQQLQAFISTVIGEFVGICCTVLLVFFSPVLVSLGKLVVVFCLYQFFSSDRFVLSLSWSNVITNLIFLNKTIVSPWWVQMVQALLRTCGHNKYWL